jgi:hypothetical protein
LILLAKDQDKMTGVGEWFAGQGKKKSDNGHSRKKKSKK